jgi:hypothetical protein
MDLSRISKKSPHEDLRMTLTAIDSKTIENYDNYYNTLSDKKKLLTQLIRKKNSSRTKYSNEYHDVIKKISDLENEIENIENQTQKINYLMKAAPYFLEYSNQTNSQTAVTSLTVTDENENPNDGKFFVSRNGINRGKICQNYIKDCIGEGGSLSTKSNETEITQELTCKICGVEKLTNPRESYASCPKCGEISKYQDTQNNKGEYSEEVEVVSSFAYKRINHFKELISTLVGREGSGPQQTVIDEIYKELKKDKIEERNQVTEKLIKGYLKKLNYTKLYENIPAIIYKICRIPPLKIGPKLEAKLISMFQQIQVPFEKHAPKKRKNFLSYIYCIYKMLQLLRQDHLLDKLPLLKSREKLYQQDLIWKGICSENKWLYIPSL